MDSSEDVYARRGPVTRSGRYIFVYIFLGLGLFALATGTVRAKEAWLARSWPVAKGRIIQSKVSEARTSRGNIRLARLCLDLDYLYLVGDTVYEGHRLNAGWRCFASESRIRELLKRYPSGKAVRVYYNPHRPREAMLEPGLDWSIFFLWGVGFITVSLMWPFVRGEKRRRRNVRH